MGSFVLDGPIDELILKAIGGDETVRQSLLNAEEKLASSITNPDHVDLLKVVYKFQKKFGRLPNWSDLDDYVGGMQRNAGLLADLDRLREAADTYEPLFDSLEVLIDDVCQHAERETLNKKLDIAKRIAGTGWEDPKTKRVWQGNDDAREWLAAHVKPTEQPFEEDEPEAAPSSDLKYPELAFPYAALPEGQLKLMVDKACEGGLDPGLICPSIIALVSAMPMQNAMVFTKLQQYVCLLALVGAGKDVSIDRAIDVLGIRSEIDSLWSNYAPSGERSLSHLIGDKPGTKTNPARVPGPLKHCIVTYELEDTLKKSKAETSGVLQAMQHYWDHCNKTFSDGKTGKQVVNCRLSWLTAMPVGDDEIDEDTFRHAWGEGTAHGIADRMIWGFSEVKFDGRKSYKWSVPASFNNFTIVDESPMENSLVSGIERHETLYARYSRWAVKDWAPGIEQQFMEWTDGVGRETYHVRKIAVLCALINFHEYIQQEDWDFAVAFMLWQQRIRKAFATGKAKKVHQGEFNEMFLKALAKEVERLESKGEDGYNAKFVNVGGRKCAFVRVKHMGNKYRWAKFGLPLDRTTQQLVEAGEIDYLDSGERDSRTGAVIPDKGWVRPLRRRVR